MVKTFARVVEALPSAVLIGVGLPVLSMVTAVVNSIGTVHKGFTTVSPPATWERC